MLLLPTIILYLAAGFLYLQVFHFTAYVQNPSEFQHLFVKSLIVGFILYSCAYLVPFRTTSKTLNIVLFLIVTCIFAYVCGQVYRCNWFNKILQILHIKRTINPYIWYDILDSSKVPCSLWVYLEYSEPHVSYFGILSAVEDFQRQPLITLYSYTKVDFASPQNNRDYTFDPTKRVLLDSSRASIIELVYDEQSDNVKDIKEIIAAQNATDTIS